MAVRSARLVDPTPLAPGGAVVYTAPPGAIVLVKSLRVCNVTEETQTLRLALNVFDALHAIVWDIPVPASSVFGDTTWWCMEPDDTLHASCPNADALVLMASGAVLSLG